MSDWNQSVVVRGSTDAASGGGGSVATVVGPALHRHAASDAVRAAGIVQPYTSTKRQLMAPPPEGAPSTLLDVLDHSAAAEVTRTFWKPTQSKNELGLLETLHRRTDGNTLHLLVSTRPALELRHNFSTVDGDCIQLDDDLFKLSKTHFALRHMERVDDHVTVDGQTLKSNMREHLPQLHHDDYYLVRYRDYSDWAVREHKHRSRKDSTLGPRYVEQCFAVRVGQNAGVFIPITEPQLIFGGEILDQQRLSASPAQVASKAINLFALNTDQFRSISAIANPVLHTTASSSSQEQQHAGATRYVAPNPWDWTPAAIERRINHFLEAQYRSVGRMVVKGCLTAFCLYLFVQFVRRGTGLTTAPTPSMSSSASSRRRGSGSGRRGYRADFVDPVDDNGGSVIGRAVRGIFVTGPKEFFDFILGA